jgi:glycosyltransferase involved in cell wall biosynthesis
MKVLYILEDSRFGGMNKMIIDLCAEFQRSNVVSPHLIIGLAHSEVLEKYLSQKKIPYTRVPLGVLSKNIPALLRYSLTFIPDLIRLLILIQKIKPDLVYCNGSQQIKGVLAAATLGNKVLWHMHDTNQPRVLVRLFHWVAGLAKVDRYVSSSERTSRFYRLPQKRTLVSLPQLNLTDFTHFNGRKPDFPKKEYLVTTIANINPDKGIDTLLRTAAEVRKARQDVRFRVIGLRPESQKTYWTGLTKLMDELSVQHVEFLGQRTDVYDLLNESDLYLCTSNNESGPLAVFEALAVGLPVVTTDVGDLSRLFATHGYGKVHPVGGYQSLAEEILELLSASPKCLTQKVAAGKTLVSREAEVAGSAGRHVAFYTKIIHE